MKVKKRKWIISVSAALLVMILFFTGYSRINREYPETDLVIVNKGESLSYTNNLELSVQSSEFMTDNWKKEYSYIPDPQKCEVIHVVLNADNHSNEDATLDLTNLYIQTNGFSTAIQAEIGASVNPDESELRVVIPAEGERNLDLYYELDSIAFTSAQWKNIRKSQFWISCREYYPERQRMLL